MDVLRYRFHHKYRIFEKERTTACPTLGPRAKKIRVYKMHRVSPSYFWLRYPRFVYPKKTSGLIQSCGGGKPFNSYFSKTNSDCETWRSLREGSKNEDI